MTDAEDRPAPTMPTEVVTREWLARSFALSRRRDNLSAAHHVEAAVAVLEAAVRRHRKADG